MKNRSLSSMPHDLAICPASNAQCTLFCQYMGTFMSCIVIPENVRPMVVAVTRSLTACLPRRFTARVSVSICLAHP